MRLESMKVGTRLAGGFALLVLASLTIAVLARIQLVEVGDVMDSFVNERMEKYDATNQLIDNIKVVARASRSAVLYAEAQAIQQERDRIGQACAHSGRLFDRLQALVQPGEDRQLFDAASAARGPYKKAIDRVLGLAEQGKNDEARDLLLRDVRPLQDSLFSALHALLAYERSRMQEDAGRLQSMAHSAGWTMLVIALATGGIGGLASWFITRSLTRQLGGELAYATKVARQIADGNLAIRVRLRQGDQSSLLAAMHAMRDSLARVVQTVREGSDSVATASSEIAQGNHDLSARTEAQASALQQTVSSMEQLGSTVQLNADHARKAKQLAQSASDVAVQGGEVVAEVVSTMKGIDESSRRIADIIGTIDGMALQTNILALNAAVEAARAGEQGRGFAVVAGEVRALAKRSAEAAREIRALIKESVARVERGTALVDRAGSTMEGVVHSIRRVGDIVGEISAASAEQRAGVSQVGGAMSAMDQSTQQNAALVEQSAAAASLRQQAQQLVDAVGVFRLAEVAVPFVMAWG